MKINTHPPPKESKYNFRTFMVFAFANKADARQNEPVSVLEENQVKWHPLWTTFRKPHFFHFCSFFSCLISSSACIIALLARDLIGYSFHTLGTDTKAINISFAASLRKASQSSKLKSSSESSKCRTPFTKFAAHPPPIGITLIISPVLITFAFMAISPFLR